MAYMNQERKAKIAANLKAVMPQGWKYSLSVRNHSTICLCISQAPLDLLGHIRNVIANKSYGAKPEQVGSYWGVNHYYLDNQFEGEVLELFQKIKAALNDGNHDNSDPQTDYFDVGWYVDIDLGKWNSPFLDTIPAPARVSKVKAVSASAVKPPKSAYEKYLPAGWAEMSPGKKAAATKQAISRYVAFES